MLTLGLDLVGYCFTVVQLKIRTPWKWHKEIHTGKLKPMRCNT